MGVLLWSLILSAPFQAYDMNYLVAFLAIALSVLIEVIIILMWAKRGKKKGFWFEALLFMILCNPVSLLIGLKIMTSYFGIVWQV